MSEWPGIDPQTAAGMSTLAAVVTQWQPTLRNSNLAAALRLAAAQMARMEDVLRGAQEEYANESYSEDTRSAIDDVLAGGGQ